MLTEEEAGSRRKAGMTKEEYESSTWGQNPIRASIYFVVPVQAGIQGQARAASSRVPCAPGRSRNGIIVLRYPGSPPAREG